LDLSYARWLCYKNLTYVQEMDIYSKEIKHTTHEKAARTTHEKTAYLTKFHSTVQVQRTEYKVQ
jgi:geranylgeranyl pyrophosphate synthase